MILALTKSLLYLGAVLLVGAGVFAGLVAARTAPGASPLLPRRTLRLGALAGAALLLAASAVDVALTLRGVLGYVDAELIGRYLRGTRHGAATLVRTGLTVALAALLLAGAPRRRLGGWLVGALGLGLLATFSWISHAAAMGGTPPLLADLAHFAAAAAWGGSVLYLALSPAWSEGAARPALVATLRRVSRVGLIAVAALFATGVYATLTHLQDPARFVASPYGFALYAKLALVLAIVGVAAFNRLSLLPAFLRGGAPGRFRTVLRAEALLLVAVFVATGVLTTSALPHGDGATTGAAENLVKLLDYLRR